MDYKQLTERLLKFDSAMGPCEEIGCPDLCAPGEDCVVYNAVTAITELLSRAEAAEARAEAAEKKVADVRPVVRGRWVKIYEDGEPAVAQHQVGVCCSKCMKMPEDKFTESDFCPRCGANMKGEIGGEE